MELRHSLQAFRFPTLVRLASIIGSTVSINRHHLIDLICEHVGSSGAGTGPASGNGVKGVGGIMGSGGRYAKGT